MNLERIAASFLPPRLAWHVSHGARERRELVEFAEFYRTFLTNGDLCFDIGANLGNRTHCFRHIGCSVVAVEPQRQCFTRLERRFSQDSHVTLVCCALGRSEGSATLHVSPNHVLSTLSGAFIDRTQASGRFAGAEWNQTEIVAVSTLDALIAEHGVPQFIKIDVEGFESEVIGGLSTAVPALSIEWVPEFPENARECLKRLSCIADYEFNLSWGESMRFSRPEWRSLESMLNVIAEFEGESSLFGDIYARQKHLQPVG